MGFHSGLVEAFDQTGDIITALVLSQIRYWYQPGKKGQSKLTVRPGWLVKSHRDWHDELRLSQQQVRTALNKLRARGVIETEVRKFRGAPTTQIRLIGFVAGNKSIGCQQQILYTDNTDSTYELSKDSSFAFAKGSMNADDVLKKAEEKKNSKIVVKNAAQLVIAWERIVPKFHKDKIGGIFKPLNGKERGMLSKYMKAVGKDNAHGAMEWAVANWFTFQLEVKNLKGDLVPQLPQAGMLLKHWDVALKCYLESVQLTATQPGNVIKFVTKQGVKVGG